MSIFRYILIAGIFVVVAIILYNIWTLEKTLEQRNYTEFLAILEKGLVKEVHVKGGEIKWQDASGEEFMTFSPDPQNLVPRLVEKKVVISSESDRPSELIVLFRSLIPVLLILGGWFIFVKFQSGKSHEFAKTKAFRFSADYKKVTFDGIAGIPEVKEELFEIVEFLKQPEKYVRLGGRIPKGVLLQGPPGTGKTLIAKAIAGEAHVPFYSISGSDFVEMFVGVGASRVRELFREAKKNSPCIIFIDEIDAVGARRGAGDISGGQDEREQTLNALLVEMDGFSSNETVIIIGATNRLDIIDPALLRAGRFDRQITVPLPDIKGRLEILKLYTKNVVAEKALDLAEIARTTPGFSGADLANLVNEAALMAARLGKKAINMSDFEKAKDKILMGLERKSVVVSEKERRVTAYHEAGHALVAKLLPETDPLHKISIIPRGRAMGVTQQVPLDDRHVYSEEYLINRIKILLGGRVAEELVFDQYTTGARNDLMAATEIATKMVCEWGMNVMLGPLSYMDIQSGFLANLSSHKKYSEQTAQMIDSEIRKLIEKCYAETLALLKKNNKLLHKLAEVLLIHETVDAEELDIVISCVSHTNSHADIEKLTDHERRR